MEEVRSGHEIVRKPKKKEKREEKLNEKKNENGNKMKKNVAR